MTPPQKDLTPIDGPPWTHQIYEWLRRTARAVADLALGLAASEKRAEMRHEEMKGLVMAALTQKPQKPASTANGRGDEPSDRFDVHIADGVDASLVVSRKRQRRIAIGLGVAVFVAATHLVQWIIERELNHAPAPVAHHRDDSIVVP